MYLALLEMQATLCENLHVDIVSHTLSSSTDTVAIIAVKQLPPVIMEHNCINRLYKK